LLFLIALVCKPLHQLGVTSLRVLKSGAFCLLGGSFLHANHVCCCPAVLPRGIAGVLTAIAVL
jgi:hypothetical protein